MGTDSQTRPHDHFAKWGEKGPNNSTRVAQNNSMIVKCLQESLTKAAVLQITPHIASVTVDLVMMTPLLF